MFFFLTEVFFFVFERERKDFQVQLKLNNFSQREKETKITSSDNNSELLLILSIDSTTSSICWYD